MTIRDVRRQDLEELLKLYAHLHDNPMPELDSRVTGIWEGILADPNHHILVGEEEGAMISSCLLL